MSKESVSQPPAGGRFRKGQSGNPKGRPRKVETAKPGSAFDIIIDKMLTVTQGGVPREVTVEEALQHQTYKDAIAGNRAARREVLKMIAKREAYLAARESKPGPKVEIRKETDPTNADDAMLILGIACHNPERQDLDREEHQLLLEPWAVQAALDRRRGGRKLTAKEIADIKRCTEDAGRLRWPRGSSA